MKMKEFAAKIAVIAGQYPNVEAIYAKDEEGNGFEAVFYGPTAGHFDDDGEFVAHDVDANEPREINAICVN